MTNFSLKILVKINLYDSIIYYLIFNKSLSKKFLIRVQFKQSILSKNDRFNIIHSNYIIL